jgi:hypothetical protein
VPDGQYWQNQFRVDFTTPTAPTRLRLSFKLFVEQVGNGAVAVASLTTRSNDDGIEALLTPNDPSGDYIRLYAWNAPAEGGADYVNSAILGLPRNVWFPVNISATLENNGSIANATLSANGGTKKVDVGEGGIPVVFNGPPSMAMGPALAGPTAGWSVRIDDVIFDAQ